MPPFAVILLILIAFLFLLFYPLRPRPPLTATVAPAPRNINTTAASAADFHDLFLSSDTESNLTISTHLKALTLGPHLAGTPSSLSAADYVLHHFRLAGLRTLTRRYQPLLSYPSHSSLSIHHDGRVRALSLSDTADENKDAVVRPYHAYSPSGSFLSPPVYINYGRDEDYEKLSELGVDVRGCIVIVRRGGGYRGAVVQRAADRGAVAVLVFREEGSGDDAMLGRGGVERGTLLMGQPGDPLTPGWAAEVGGERLNVEDVEVRKRLPRIPSMPVPTAAAEEILRVLGGPRVPNEWRGFIRLDGVSGIGRGPALLNFTYQEERKLEIIQNIFGIIEGHEEPERYVILGNHRDAWTYGAVDPNSGTAALLDITRRFHILLRAGWRPRRTIILCSWDAEEFGMIGSTEWVEQNIENLSLKAVAYLNVDCAVQGPGFFASATPQLDELLYEVTKKVKDPDFEHKNIFQTWSAESGGAKTKIERLSRSDSDFSAFLHFAGIPSIDLYFGKDYPVYHTVFDSYEWMEKYGDPLFHRHVAVAGVWGLLALRLADDAIIPFDYLSYAAQLQEQSNNLHAFLSGDALVEGISRSISDFFTSAKKVKEETLKLLCQKNVDDLMLLRRRALNDQMMLVERAFLDLEGLKGRPWFKHTIYSPPELYENEKAFFPGVADVIHLADKMVDLRHELPIQHEIWRVSRAILRASMVLKGELA